jgi:hypothetical protein
MLHDAELALDASRFAAASTRGSELDLTAASTLASDLLDEHFGAVNPM